MRKVLISAVLAASTLAIAAPAAAQYGQPYGAPYGNAYGYNNNHGQVRNLMVRVNQIERQIAQLDRRNILSDREAYRLRNEANALERRIRQASYNGLNYREQREIQVRIAQLELRVRREATDGNRWGNRQYGSQYGNQYGSQYGSQYGGQYGSQYGNQYGYNGYDRDRDGRDDRYEDDRGYRRD